MQTLFIDVLFDVVIADIDEQAFGNGILKVTDTASPEEPLVEKLPD